MRKVCFALLSAAPLALSLTGCGLSKSNTQAQNAQAVAVDTVDVLGAAALALNAFSTIPLPQGVAGTQAAEQFQYWTRYSAGVAPQLAAVVSELSGQAGRAAAGQGAPANPTPAR